MALPPCCRTVLNILTEFREAATSAEEVHLEEYTSSVTSYISKSVDDVTTTKTITIHPNQKPWLNAEVCSLLKTCDSAFRSDDASVLRAARRNLNAGKKMVKATYALKIQGHFSSNNPWSMWSLQGITNYTRRDAKCPRDLSLPEALNTFYDRFEDSNTTPGSWLIPSPNELSLSVTATDVRRSLQKINPCKAAGPDNIPGLVLRDCAHQLSRGADGHL